VSAVVGCLAQGFWGARGTGGALQVMCLPPASKFVLWWTGRMQQACRLACTGGVGLSGLLPSKQQGVLCITAPLLLVWRLSGGCGCAWPSCERVRDAVVVASASVACCRSRGSSCVLTDAWSAGRAAAEQQLWCLAARAWRGMLSAAGHIGSCAACPA
jgi:hypothetical protein